MKASTRAMTAPTNSRAPQRFSYKVALGLAKSPNYTIYPKKYSNNPPKIQKQRTIYPRKPNPPPLKTPPFNNTILKLGPNLSYTHESEP